MPFLGQGFSSMSVVLNLLAVVGTPGNITKENAQAGPAPVSPKVLDPLQLCIETLNPKSLTPKP